MIRTMIEAFIVAKARDLLNDFVHGRGTHWSLPMQKAIWDTAFVITEGGCTWLPRQGTWS